MLAGIVNQKENKERRKVRGIQPHNAECFLFSDIAIYGPQGAYLCQSRLLGS